jgi:hypothetical protein
MPEGDQRVFADPEIQAMFIDDIVRVLAGKAPCQAVVDDARLFGRRMGFPTGRRESAGAVVARRRRLTRVIQRCSDCGLTPADVELLLMPDESHLDGFAVADDVLGFIRSL